MEYAFALEKRLEWLRWTNDPGVTDTHNRVIQERSFDIYKQILESGDTYFMNKRFCELVDVARRTIPDDLKFETEWMLSPNGFMWLEVPFETPKPLLSREEDIKLIDQTGPMGIAAVGWQRIPETYITRQNKREGTSIQKTLGEELKPGAYQFVCFLNWRHFNPAAPQGFGMWSYFVLNPGSKVLDRIHRFEKNSADATLAAAAYSEGRVTDMMHEIRWIFAAMHLMSQKLAAKEDHQAQRAARRRMAKEKSPLVPLIKVITLRRLQQYQKPEGPSQEVNWQWQWPVTGHWRNQWIPSANEHRLTWIEDYIKGPIDAPFKPPQTRIFKAER